MELQQELSKSSLKVSENLGEDLTSIMAGADQLDIPPFMNFFGEEQQKYIKCSSRGIRYHPMIIRFCLSLASKSALAYDDIRYDKKSATGILILPSRRQLRDYKNYIKPESFNKNINELKNKIKNFSDNEKFFVILMDEMKIQSNFVWDKHTGELIGYVDLVENELNYATLKKTDNIATHILAFLIRSMVNWQVKYSLLSGRASVFVN